MKRVPKILFLTLSILSLSLILGLLVSRQARAAVSALVSITNGVRNPVPINNLGAPSSLMVSLTCVDFGHTPVLAVPANTFCTNWSFNTASGEQLNYAVPAGYNLVITDIEAQAVIDPQLQLPLILNVVSTSDGQTLLGDASSGDSNGLVSFREHLTTGFACSTLPNIFLTVSRTPFPNSLVLTVQGYLTASSS